MQGPYEDGRNSGGGNPWAGSSDSDRWSEHEDGYEDDLQDEAEEDAND